MIIPLNMRRDAEELMALANHEADELGRAVLRDGRLRLLRVTLGLTRNAMADLLYTSPLTYTSWEERDVSLWPRTAIRIGRFYRAAEVQLSHLKEIGVRVEDMVPFHIVATLLGLPQEQLLHKYRDGEFAATEAGVLGLWVSRIELTRLRGQ